MADATAAVTVTSGASATVRSLVSRLAEVMAEIGNVPKRGVNAHFNYKFATEVDVVGALQKKLAARGIMLFPSVVAVRRDGKLTAIDMTFTFVDGQTDERITSAWAGYGEDNSDKAIWKAITGATKYFILKTFLVPTGDDPEATDAQGRRADKAPKPEPTGRATSNDEERISKAKRDRLGQLLNTHNTDRGWLADQLKKLGYRNSADIKNKDYAKVERAIVSGVAVDHVDET
jgi:hypothetical protein